MTLSQCFRISPRAMQTAMGEGAVLVDTATGNCFELNRVGRSVLKRLAAGEAVATVTAGVAAEYGMPLDAVDADVRRLIDDLVAHGLLLDSEP